MKSWCYIEDVVDAMDMANDLVTHFLDLRSGEVIPVTEEAMLAAEAEEEGAELSGLDEESLDLIRTIQRGESDDFVELPTRREVNEYRMIEQFIERQTDENVFKELSRVIRGKGAFRRFKDAVRRLGLEDAWYEYREVRFIEIAEAWCEEHGIAARRRAPS